MEKILASILLVLFLSGCSAGFGEKRIKLFTVEEPRAKLDLESPAPLTLEDIRWIIITSENADEVFKKLEAEGYDPVLFGLTDKEYEMIAKNFAKIRSYLKEQNAILEKYREYYEEDNSKKENTNKAK
tara:strand:+ start:931 stop:1314 length:384 start_codon:yes stop_codon:yes gene_type:complete